ncbi:MAG: hypothetical protein EPN91_12965 [Salinibacterium sp.]|nr:MAG: hypothetical protein EPN91_12965 [Salinibacterium sp.]
MFLDAFLDELAQQGRPTLAKTAGILAPKQADRLFERMTAAGALGSTAMFGAQKAKAGLTPEPWDGPQGGVGMAAAKGAGGGAMAAALIALLGRLGQRKAYGAKRR